MCAFYNQITIITYNAYYHTFGLSKRSIYDGVRGTHILFSIFSLTQTFLLNKIDVNLTF